MPALSPLVCFEFCLRRSGSHDLVGPRAVLPSRSRHLAVAGTLSHRGCRPAEAGWSGLRLCRSKGHHFSGGTSSTIFGHPGAGGGREPEMKSMSTWLSWLWDPGAPAWFQAFGAVFAIPATVFIAGWQRSKSLRDVHVAQARLETQNLARLTTGLKAEVNAVIGAVHRQQSASEQALEFLKMAQAQGAVIKADPIQPGSINAALKISEKVEL